MLPFYLSKDVTTPLYGYDYYENFKVHNIISLGASATLLSPNLTNITFNSYIPPLPPCGTTTWLLNDVERFNMSSSFNTCFLNSSFIPCLPSIFNACFIDSPVTLEVYEAQVNTYSYLYYYAEKEVKLNYRLNSKGRIRDDVDITKFNLIVDLDLNNHVQAFKKGNSPSIRWETLDFVKTIESINLWLYVDQNYQLLNVRDDYPYRELSKSVGIAFWHVLFFSLSFALSTYLTFTLKIRR